MYTFPANVFSKLGKKKKRNLVKEFTSYKKNWHHFKYPIPIAYMCPSKKKKTKVKKNQGSIWKKYDEISYKLVQNPEF